MLPGLAASDAPASNGDADDARRPAQPMHRRAHRRRM